MITIVTKNKITIMTNIVITIIRFFLVNYNPLGLPTVLMSINPNQSFNHYQVNFSFSKNVLEYRVIQSKSVCILLVLQIEDLHFNDISLQKLMLTSHTKLNLPTNPCQKDPDYNFQALRFMFMSTLVIAAKNTNDTYLTQACVRESLAKRLDFMIIMKIRIME